MFHCSTNFFLCGSGSRPSYSQQQRMEIYVYFFGIFSMSFHCISSFIKCHQFLLQCASCLLFFLLTSSISFCSGSFSFPLLFTVSKSRLSAFKKYVLNRIDFFSRYDLVACLMKNPTMDLELNAPTFSRFQSFTSFSQTLALPHTGSGIQFQRVSFSLAVIF